MTPARAIGTAVKRAFLLRGSDGPEGALFPLPSQLSMFADESARPDGLHYQPDFISAQEEAALIGHIRALPLAPFQFGIYEGKRRVVFFGSRYDFTHQRLEAVEELPAWLGPLAGRASASRPSGQRKDDDFDVLADGVVVGRIMKAAASPQGMSWLWTLASKYHEDRTSTHGCAATREAANDGTL